MGIDHTRPRTIILVSASTLFFGWSSLTPSGVCTSNTINSLLSLSTRKVEMWEEELGKKNQSRFNWKATPSTRIQIVSSPGEMCNNSKVLTLLEIGVEHRDRQKGTDYEVLLHWMNGPNKKQAPGRVHFYRIK